MFTSSNLTPGFPFVLVLQNPYSSVSPGCGEKQLSQRWVLWLVWVVLERPSRSTDEQRRYFLSAWTAKFHNLDVLRGGDVTFSYRGSRKGERLLVQSREWSKNAPQRLEIFRLVM